MLDMCELLVLVKISADDVETTGSDCKRDERFSNLNGFLTTAKAHSESYFNNLEGTKGVPSDTYKPLGCHTMYHLIL